MTLLQGFGARPRKQERQALIRAWSGQVSMNHTSDSESRTVYSSVASACQGSPAAELLHTSILQVAMVACCDCCCSACLSTTMHNNNKSMPNCSYTSDLVAASALPGLDLIIGGHSHSFLWPDPDSPPAFYISNEAESGSEHDSTWGPYPTYVHNKGRGVPVVQASWGSRYMGKLVLNFKPEAEGGKLAGIKSEVFLLGGPKSEAHVPEDEEALQEIQKWRKW